jgi:ribose transport system permease protein
VFLGSTQLSPGKMNVWGTLVAILVLAAGVQGLQLVTGVTWVAAMFNGAALIAAVALAVGRERRMARGGRRTHRRDTSVTDEDESAIERIGEESPTPASHVARYDDE